MKISLSNFKSKIDRVIVERGEGYFCQGLVRELEEIDEGQWLALVEGTEDYNIKVKIENDEIIESVCDCPYDLGHFCKHEVAVYCAVQKYLTEENKFAGEAISRSKIKSKKKAKRKTVAETIDETLKELSHESLVEMIRDYALENREFCSIVLSQKVLESSGDSKKVYRQIIKESLRSARDRHGLIDYWSGERAVRGAMKLMDKADQLVSKNKAEQAMPIYQIIIEELIPELQRADDSDGDFGEATNWAFEQLNKCADLIKDKNIKEELFNYCLNEADHKRYNGWSDWQWDFLRIAPKIISNDDEEKSLFAKADEICSKSDGEFSGSYNHERAAEIKLDVIKRRGDKKKAEEFISDNLRYTPIRRIAIEKAFSDKNFSQAKQLANDGIEQDKDYLGLVAEWLNWLLKIAELEKNKEDIKKYTKKLFFETGEFNYYDELKKAYSQKDWKAEVKKLLKELSKEENSRASNYYTFAEIFIKEEQWQKLLNLVKKNISMDILNSYHKYLAKRFPGDLIMMYEQLCRKELIQAIGRVRYQEVCRMLRRMKKLGAGEKVSELIDEFRITYKNRRALLDELNQV